MAKEDSQEQTPKGPRRLSQLLRGVRAGLNRRDGQGPTLTEELRSGQQEVLDIGHEVADIAQDLQALVQHEVRLAGAELGQQLRLSSQALVWGGIALALGFLKLAFLAVAGMFALALILPLWISALITAGVLLVLAMGAGLIAYQRFRQVSLIPQRTMESLKEDVTWISDRLKSNGR